MAKKKTQMARERAAIERAARRFIEFIKAQHTASSSTAISGDNKVMLMVFLRHMGFDPSDVVFTEPENGNVRLVVQRLGGEKITEATWRLNWYVGITHTQLASPLYDEARLVTEIYEDILKWRKAPHGKQTGKPA